MNKKIVIIGIAVVLGILIYSSAYIVRENEYAVITSFGRPVRTVKEAGLYLKRPLFLQNVHRFNSWTNTFRTIPIQLLLGDKNPLIVTAYVCWKIEDPEIFFAALNFPQEENAVLRLTDIINNQLGSTLGMYKLDSIVNKDKEKVKLNEIEEKILKNIQESVMERYGVSVKAFGIRSINYPLRVAESIYNRMRAEREKESMKYRAEGQREAMRIEDETNKERALILSEAYRDAEKIRGEGDKEAIRIYAEAYSQNADFFEFIKSLEAYSQMLKNQTTLVISTESEFLKYLNKVD